MNRLCQWMKDLKLRNKLYLVYLAAGLIPMLVLGGYCFRYVNRLLMDREIKNLQNSLNQAMTVVDNQLTIYENMSDYLAFNQAILQTIAYPYEDDYYEMYNQITTVLDPMVTSLKYLHNDIRQVTIYATSEIEKHDSTVAPLSEIKDEPWFRQISVSRKILWVIDQEKRKVFCVRNMPNLQTELGVLYLEVDYDKLFEPFTQMLDENYGVYVQKSGKMVYSYNAFQSPYDKRDFSQENLDLLKNSQESEFIFVEGEFEGEAGIRAGMYRPAAQLRATVLPMTRGIFYICGASMIAAGILLTQMTKLIVKRMEHLTGIMKHVKSGNLDVTISSSSRDEIGELICGFDEMVKRIKTLIEEVYESKLSLKEFEMRALQAQINPHFLYNSLSLINWKAIEADQKDISKITLALSRFYRTSLNKGNSMTTVKDEIGNIRSYLDIQQMMHDYEFDVELEVDERLFCNSTPNLILQPLVENAIDHGIDVMTERRGKIRIRGWSEQDTMYLMVEDNGVGMDEETAGTIMTGKSKGYGVRNVDERLKLTYGVSYGITVDSREGQGTRMTVKLPIVIGKAGEGI